MRFRKSKESFTAWAAFIGLGYLITSAIGATMSQPAILMFLGADVAFVVLALIAWRLEKTEQ